MWQAGLSCSECPSAAPPEFVFSHPPNCRSAEDHLAASLKADPILADLQAAALTAADPGQHTTAKAAADKAPQLSRDEVRAMRQQADPNFGKRKQQAQAQEGGKGGDMRPPPAKKPRTAASGANSVEVPAPAAAAAPAEGMQPAAGSEGGAPAAPAAQQQEQAAAPAQQEQGQQGQEPGEPAHGRPAWRQQRRTEANTAFVKHLADAVDEAALQQLFGSVPGGVKGVELGHDRKTGRSKVGGLAAARGRQGGERDPAGTVWPAQLPYNLTQQPACPPHPTHTPGLCLRSLCDGRGAAGRVRARPHRAARKAHLRGALQAARGWPPPAAARPRPRRAVWRPRWRPRRP